MNLVLLESLLNLLLDNVKISIFSKVDKMYLLLYWVTYFNIQLKLNLYNITHPVTRVQPGSVSAVVLQLEKKYQLNRMIN